MTLLLNALKDSNATTLKEKMKTLMNTFIAARQMGETEAYYKIFPDFHLKDSNVTTVFVPVSKKENRSKFLLKIDEETNYNGQEKFKVEGREGYFVEKYDIVSKFERCENKPNGLSYCQFAKMYSPAWKDKECKDDNHETNDSDMSGNEEIDNFDKKESKFNYVMKCFGHPHENCKTRKTEELPQYLKLSTVFPGEPPFMKKRKFPAVLRFHKFKLDTHPSEFFFSEALLYKPFRNEQDILDDIENIDAADYHHQIQCVKEQVMEHLENVTEARYFVEENARNEETEMNLNPEGIQEIDECEYEGIIDHPDFPDFDIEALEQDTASKTVEKTKVII